VTCQINFFTPEGSTEEGGLVELDEAVQATVADSFEDESDGPTS